MDGYTSVSCGDSQTYTITPNTCYSVASVLVDGSPLAGPFTSPYTYTFSNVQADHTISATFTLKTYNITTSAGSNGGIAPLGNTSVSCGGSQTYTITPNTCYSVASVLVDGSPLAGPFTSPYTYTFFNVQADHTISATFTLKTYNITASAGSNGGIAPLGNTSVSCGGSQTYTITPNTCYSVASVLVDGSPLAGPFTSPYTYTFSNVQADHTISATFTLKTYNITASAGSNGGIAPLGNTSVSCGGSQTYTITPNTCYSVASVLVDGISQGAITTYTFSNVQVDHTISATFTLKTYNITASAGSNGSIAPLGNISVNCGGSQTYTITPNTCYSVASVLVDGVSHGAITTYTFSDVQANHTISATFTLKTYNITASAGTGGTISPSGNTSVNCNGNQIYTITPSTCYSVASVLVDGISQGAITTYTFSNVQADHTISATFTLKTYNITATAGTGGTISPSGNTSVNCSSSQTYVITANTCFNITDIIINGVSQGPQTNPYTYTFTNVQSNQNISALFALKTYSISASASTGGSISPNGTVLVTCGYNQTFTITANACYNISSILIDGFPLTGSLTSPYTYTFTNVQTTHTISVTFSQTTYTITSSAGTGGTISPSGSVAVPCGGTQNFTITAANCYNITSITVDGTALTGPFTSPYVYSFSNVQTTHTISTTFSSRTFNITASAGTGGSISPSGNLTYNCGSNQTFTITSSSGYYILNVLVDGVSVGTVSTYTFTNISADHTIQATFRKTPVCGTITGNVTNQTTGAGVSGITVNVFYQGTTTLVGTAVTDNNGYYVVTGLQYHPDTQYEVYCLGSSTYTVTSTNPVALMLNNGSKCTQSANFTVIYVGSNTDDFVYNSYPKFGTILDDGQITFTVTGANSYIRINSVTYNFNIGDTVTIYINTAQSSGNAIYIRSSGSGYEIDNFGFDNVTVYKNSVAITTGTVDDIYVSKTGTFSSTLILNIPKGQYYWASFTWGGVYVFYPFFNSQGVTIWNIRPDSTGILNVNLDNLYAKGMGDNYDLY